MEAEWSLREEVEAYLKTDVRLLYTALMELAEALRRDFRLNIEECVTLSGAAMRYYRTNHLSQKVLDQGSFVTQLPDLFKTLRKTSYVGGLVVNPGKGKVHRDAFAYDMRSMYPSMIHGRDMPGGQVI